MASRLSRLSDLGGSGLSSNFWINLVGFQLIWWSLVLWGNAAMPVALLLLLIHVFLHFSPRKELQLMLVVAVVGFAVDSLLTLSGVFRFSSADLPSPIWPPLWLLVLWFAFAATLNQTLNWFSGRYRLAALIGGPGGSSTYLAASELGAVSFGPGVLSSVALLTLVWALLFPLLILLKDRIEVHHVCMSR
ncbi:DUF2878 domain-containing protein [Marinobacterium lutimaris]|uniref:DUF2878 domain-containing protein n=1 Tax=Marinobacterium lutimaris TaxID=568106 RepID=A0A1H5XK22_9GAMM|nr:DUF2878 domain-containing protein [Marinobacterium lutimaris]SEG11576.1 Protein of unknown function [Marinobacterium lutimaris]